MFFILLTISERRNAGRKGAGRIPERFRLESRDDLSPKSLGVRPGGIVVGVHDPDQLGHLHGVLEHSDPSKQDVILVAVKPGNAADFQQGNEPDRVVGEWEVRVFTTAVAAAEDAGKPVVLVGLVGDRPYGTVLQAAHSLQSGSVVVGVSEQGVEWQTGEIQSDWRQMEERNGDMHVEIVPDGNGASTCIDLEPAGAAPR